MPKEWTAKQEREYEHIRESEKSRGASDKRAKEIGARTVNKNRARSGQSRSASRSSVQDLSPQRRGGKRSHSGAQGPTYDQLYNEARQRNIDGRSKMNKSQLAHALGRD
ncbi:plasmid stabilization protein [Nocardia spumae]|uniref:plasmid stabilization protein n=1 Tax=Nocardia spumae TaxID=2887190 RepID=UPI001D137377|nr:plasmid stabilization protein [Nocardia spumae]